MGGMNNDTQTGFVHSLTCFKDDIIVGYPKLSVVSCLLLLNRFNNDCSKVNIKHATTAQL